MKKETSFGRITPIRDRRGRAVRGHVTISFWINDRYEPPYINPVAPYLRIETDDEFYHIYNPLSLKFSLQSVISQVRTILRMSDCDIVGFEVIDPRA